MGLHSLCDWIGRYKPNGKPIITLAADCLDSSHAQSRLGFDDIIELAHAFNAGLAVICISDASHDIVHHDKGSLTRELECTPNIFRKALFIGVDKYEIE